MHRAAATGDGIALRESRLLNSNHAVVEHRNAQTKSRLDGTGWLAGAHYDLAQRLYIGLHGRPTDAAELAF